MSAQISSGLSQQCAIVVHQAERKVTGMAEQPSHGTGGMIMVYSHPIAVAVAYETTSMLLRIHLFIGSVRHAELHLTLIVCGFALIFRQPLAMLLFAAIAVPVLHAVCCFMVHLRTFKIGSGNIKEFWGVTHHAERHIAFPAQERANRISAMPVVHTENYLLTLTYRTATVLGRIHFLVAQRSDSEVTLATVFCSFPRMGLIPRSCFSDFPLSVSLVVGRSSLRGAWLTTCIKTIAPTGVLGKPIGRLEQFTHSTLLDCVHITKVTQTKGAFNGKQ